MTWLTYAGISDEEEVFRANGSAADVRHVQRGYDGGFPLQTKAYHQHESG